MANARSLIDDPEKCVNELVHGALGAERFGKGCFMIYSAKCDSSFTRFSVSSGAPSIAPAPERGRAVAGISYPKGDSDRESLIDEILDQLATNQHSLAQRRPVNSAMVPHAGLRHSGHIMADVWSRIDLPRDILILSPKHTSDDVTWTVAPHEKWALSDSESISGNLEFATMLAEHVPGMEPDSAIHRPEHGIEVQLPFLYRFAPDSRITAIAMDDAAHSDLHEAAQALAALIKRLPRPPLLAIRSAMNHFAQNGKKPWTGPNRVGKTHCDEFSRAFRYLQKKEHLHVWPNSCRTYSSNLALHAGHGQLPKNRICIIRGSLW